MADTFHSHAPGIKTTATLQRGPRSQLRDAHKTTLTYRAPLPLDAVRPGTPLLGPRHNRLKTPMLVLQFTTICDNTCCDFQCNTRLVLSQAASLVNRKLTRYFLQSECYFVSRTRLKQAFQRMMDVVCKDLSFAFVYLDDILIASSSPEEHCEHLRTFFLTSLRQRFIAQPC